MMMSDDNPRPQKRIRIELDSDVLSSPSPFSSQSALTPLPSSPTKAPSLKPLPPHILLLSLPFLLAHPPNHRNYIQSLVLSLTSLRKCLLLPLLAPEIECRAWCGLAELGMRVINGGFNTEDAHTWAHGIEEEVDKAISKGSMIAQKHPSLRPLRLHLGLLQAQFQAWQHNLKFARTQVRNLISSLRPTDDPYLTYSAHLAAINLFAAPISPPTPSTSNSMVSSISPPAAQQLNPQDIRAALSAVQDLETLSLERKHGRITLLAYVLRLRILVAASMWQDVANVIRLVESVLGLSYEPLSTPKSRPPPHQETQKVPPARDQEEFIFFEDGFEAAMAIHALMLSVIYYTHIGAAAEVKPRLSHLHALMDACALEKFPDGTVEARFSTGPPLIIEVTHPRILFLLTFLVSCVAKRDAVGRKPKRKVFASEGLSTWDKELEQELTMPLWCSRGDVENLEQRLACIKADLLCELVAVSIMRSDFAVAEQNLNIVIAHTRSYGIFHEFAARITLHQAHLAHALDLTTRAIDCYRVAARLAEHGTFVQLSAKAGEVVLRLGLQSFKENVEHSLLATTENIDPKEALKLAKTCGTMGGTLSAVGRIIEALISPEILKAKEHLRHSLELATKAQDNHLRAVVLALVAAHYFHTAGDHAFQMLQACEQLAAGLGAPPTKNSSNDVVTGNAQLGLWVGQKFIELYRRAGKDERVKKQAAINDKLEAAVNALRTSGTAVSSG